MRRLSPFIAIVMVYLMTPGAGELTENAVHLISNGHTAHAFDDAEHEPTGAEHGCSSTFHVCQCCSSLRNLLFCPTTAFTVFRMAAAIQKYLCKAWLDAIISVH